MDKHPPLLSLVMFLSIFLLVYGGLHAFMLWRIKAALEPGPRLTGWIGLLMLLLVFAPMLERLAEHAGLDTMARLIAFTGYTWMGWIFLVFCIYLTVGLATAAGRLVADPVWLPTQRQTMLAALGLASVFILYGAFEARAIRTETVTLRTPKLPAAAGRIRIVQISDVHLGLIVRQARLQKIIDLILRAQPDMIVSTGDLVDGELGNLACLGPCLQDLHPRLGKYAVTGNHEFFAGVEQALAFTRESGFRVLRNESAVVNAWLQIAGVDDPAARYYTGLAKVSEKELLSAAAAGRFTLLLKHQPRIGEDTKHLFDLQLSGHTHGGQIFPFTLLTWLAYPRGHGLKILGDGRWVYISRGTGTWGPPIRFLAPPEITVIDVVPAAGDKNLPCQAPEIP